MAHSETVPLRRPYPLVIGRAECSSNLWGYLCERYGVNPAEAVQLELVEPPTRVRVHMKETKCRGRV